MPYHFFCYNFISLQTVNLAGKFFNIAIILFRKWVLFGGLGDIGERFVGKDFINRVWLSWFEVSISGLNERIIKTGFMRTLKHMKMRKHLFLFTFLFLLLSLMMRAQTTVSLGFSQVVTSYPDTVFYQQMYYYDLKLINTGAQSYSGGLELYWVVDSTANNGILRHFDSDSIAINTLYPNDSLSFNGTMVPNNMFRTGVNTVIIWPIAFDAQGGAPFSATDSLRFNVVMTNPNSVQDVLKQTIIIGPNPTHDKVYITTNSGWEGLEYNIVNTSGMHVAEGRYVNQIDMGYLPSGVYVLQLRFKSGQVQRFKVIKR